MSVDFTGANTEKIDKLIVAVVELRTMVRLATAVITIVLPMVVGLLVFLVVQSFHVEARLAQVEARLARVESRLELIAPARR